MMIASDTGSGDRIADKIPVDVYVHGVVANRIRKSRVVSSI
jgi:hypothetical protein